MLPLPPIEHIDDEGPLITPDDTLQLQTDVINVIEGRVPLESFDKDYQAKILSYYRFCATYSNSQHPVRAKTTKDTYDII